MSKKHRRFRARRREPMKSEKSDDMYPKGTGSTSRSSFAGCRWRASLFSHLRLRSVRIVRQRRTIRARSRLQSHCQKTAEPFFDRLKPAGRWARRFCQMSVGGRRPKLTAMAASTFSITAPSTWPIRSRSRRLSSVRICSSSTTDSLGSP